MSQMRRLEEYSDIRFQMNFKDLFWSVWVTWPFKIFQDLGVVLPRVFGHQISTRPTRTSLAGLLVQFQELISAESPSAHEAKTSVHRCSSFHVVLKGKKWMFFLQKHEAASISWKKMEETGTRYHGAHLTFRVRISRTWLCHRQSWMPCDRILGASWWASNVVDRCSMHYVTKPITIKAEIDRVKGNYFLETWSKAAEQSGARLVSSYQSLCWEVWDLRRSC